MEDLDPPKGEIGELDIEELEGRGVNDNWTSLDYLVKGFKRKSASNHKLVPIDRTPHEIHYINYLQQMTCVSCVYDEDGETYLDFLEENRIELNSIMTEIGAKRFWNWLYAKIIETFPARNYNRVIPVPPYEITLPVLDRLNTIVERMIGNSIEDEITIIRSGLRRFRGLLNIDSKMEEIDERLTDIVNEDEDIANLAKKLKKVVKSYFKDNELED